MLSLLLRPNTAVVVVAVVVATLGRSCALLTGRGSHRIDTLSSDLKYVSKHVQTHFEIYFSFLNFFALNGGFFGSLLLQN